MTLVLLDTQLLIWIAGETHKLSSSMRSFFSTSASDTAFSVVSIWEISIKAALQRPDFQVDPNKLRHGFLRAGCQELTITADHVLATRHLPHIHRDPFDRLLIAQAGIENLRLLTADAMVARYAGDIQLV